MNVTAPNTHTAITDAPDALAPSVGMLIADMLSQNLGSQFALPMHYPSERATGYFLLLGDGIESSNRTATLGVAAEELKAFANLWAERYPFTEIAPSIRPVTAHIQINSTHRPAWRPQITNAGTHEEIIAVLRMFGLDPVADRLGYLRSLVDDDPDEPTIEIESLRAMALFIMSERQLPLPRIAVSPDGLIQIEWRPEDSGILAMKFLLDGKIQFAGIGEKAPEGVERARISGTLEKDDMMRALHFFVSRLGPE